MIIFLSGQYIDFQNQVLKFVFLIFEWQVRRQFLMWFLVTNAAAHTKKATFDSIFRGHLYAGFRAIYTCLYGYSGESQTCD